MPKKMNPELNMLRLSLYEAGLADAEIAVRCSVSVPVIWKWRVKRGLTSNSLAGRKVSSVSVRLAPDTKQRCITLMRSGIGIAIIHRETSVAKSTLERWRTAMLRRQPDAKFKTLRPKAPPRHPSGRKYNAFSGDRRKCAFELYADGLNDEAIANKLGCNRHQVWEWRKALHLPVIATKATRTNAAKPKRKVGPPISPLSNALYARIALAVGRNVGPDIAADAISNIYLDIAEGTLTIDDIETKARTYVNRMLSTYANRWTRSLDEELGEHGDGFKLLDMMKDDRSSSWLEEMGATVW